jgi:hypothetical protein
MTDYSRIPVHMADAAKRYVEHGEIWGDFLEAVFSNNFVGIMHRADDINSASLREWAEFLYWEVPEGCWGSKERVRAWVEKFKSEVSPQGDTRKREAR